MGDEEDKKTKAKPAPVEKKENLQMIVAIVIVLMKRKRRPKLHTRKNQRKWKLKLLHHKQSQRESLLLRGKLVNLSEEFEVQASHCRQTLGMLINMENMVKKRWKNLVATKGRISSKLRTNANVATVLVVVQLAWKSTQLT